MAAIKAAKLGFKTAIMRREAGGTCLNRGCIPAKAMIHAAAYTEKAQESGTVRNIHAENVTYDFEKIVEYKEETTKQLVSGVEGLFKGKWS